MRDHLFIYVDGFDNSAIESDVVVAMSLLAACHPEHMKVVNDRPQSLQADDEGFLPEWQLGLNVDRAIDGSEWVQGCMTAIGDLAAALGRWFVVGSYSPETGVSEDLATIADDDTAADAADLVVERAQHSGFKTQLQAALESPVQPSRQPNHER